MMGESGWSVHEFDAEAVVGRLDELGDEAAPNIGSDGGYRAVQLIVLCVAQTPHTNNNVMVRSGASEQAVCDVV
jgi:hypothetical protein